MRILFFLLGVLAASSCRNSDSSSLGAAASESKLLSHFDELGPGDTLFVGYDQELEGLDTIPSKLLWAELDSALLEQIAYGPDSTSMVVQARGYWSQDSLRTICLMKVELFWWKFHYALVYDRAKGAFTSLQPLAEFYGGEGGQVATLSWLFDRDGDGDRDILSRTSEHALELPNDDSGEPVERHSEEVYAWQWADGGFTPVAGLDSAALVKAWPVEWAW